jgi:uncharacterized membrane protein YeaQ/YmgE (transglycosylase-associated protein family)
MSIVGSILIGFVAGLVARALKTLRRIGEAAADAREPK